MPDPSLATLLDRDPRHWRADLDHRYPFLDDVLAGRRTALIYPAARMGRLVAHRLTDIGVRVVAFGDHQPELHGTRIQGLPVLSPAQIAADHRLDVVLVASTLHDAAICADLRGRGCKAVVPVGYLNMRLPEVFRARELDGASAAATDPANRPLIERAFALFEDDHSRRAFTVKLAFYLSTDRDALATIWTEGPIYFDPSVYKLRADEVVVDGGAYIGDTLASFVRCSSGRFRAYFAFEPDGANFPQLAATDDRRITAVPAGLARRTSSARLLVNEGPDSRLLGDDETGGETVPVVSLDDYFEGRPAPTLIKMDIEGAEADALLGATRLLREFRPIQAVSAYHYPSDLWTIPLLMNRLMPDSRMYLRHYTREFDDTVCYAIPAERPNP